MTNPWKRIGLYYYCQLKAIYRGQEVIITRKLDILSYHLIWLIHGEEKLIEIARGDA